VYLTLVHIFLHVFYEQVYCHVIHDKVLTIRRRDLEFSVFHIPISSHSKLSHFIMQIALLIIRQQ